MRQLKITSGCPRHSPTAASRSPNHWRRRTDALVPPGTETDTFSASRVFAVVYPETVTLAEVIGSLRWRRLAAGGTDGQTLFAAEIGRRLGDPDYRPLAVQDPIAHWMEQDCWRPPSPPNTTYRACFRKKCVAPRNVPP
ncbi:hypothetical protein BS329_18105 [Amycolatopsis coloradensis]|uniref:Uncharacterized protein n=1 Tax=Amycolatopsis coloradensis TaxID=76021 RepID=A0A1R0KT67_9PSEU|nr:hypothetical protein [Amycolatopsis coloradensis]OLZ51153.1 hypothetical protein BS329_18105 [Amycolatopsis coloradensis]